MGATIPVLTQALARNLADATRVHALIYGWNTVGAFAGTLATGFFLIEWLGLDGVQRAMGFVNLAVGAAIVMMGLRRRELAALDSGEAPPLARRRVRRVRHRRAARGLRDDGAPDDRDPDGGARVRLLGVHLHDGRRGVRALHRAAAASRCRGGRGSACAPSPCRSGVLTLLFTGLYVLLEKAPYWAHVLRVLFRDMDAAFYPYYVSAFAFLLLVLAPAVALSGAILPLLFHALRHEVGDLGSQAGRLYSVNTLGSLLGALIGGYVLLIWLDLHHVYRIAVAALVLAATVVTLHQVPRIRFAGAAVLFLAGGRRDRVDARLAARVPVGRSVSRAAARASGRFDGPSALLARRDWRISFYDDDPNTSVAVLEIGRRARSYTRSILVNGKSDGNSAGDYSTTALLAVVPALFAERPEHAFVIGFGTGVTAGVLARARGDAERDDRRDLLGCDRGRAAVRLREQWRLASPQGARSSTAMPIARCSRAGATTT